MPDLPIRNGSDGHPSWHMINACPTTYAMNTPDGVLVTSGIVDGSLTVIPYVHVAQRWTARIVDSSPALAGDRALNFISLVREVGLRAMPVADDHAPLGAWCSADVAMPRPSDDEIRTLADLHRDAGPVRPGDDADLRKQLEKITADAEHTVNASSRAVGDVIEVRSGGAK